MEEEAAPCACCGRPTPAEDLRLWTERERLRTFSPTERAFSYAHKDHHYAVCSACRTRLEQGGAVADVRQRRAAAILIGAAVLALAIAAAAPYALPTLLDTFWQSR